MLSDAQVGRNLVALRGSVSQADLAESMRLRGFKWSKATVWAIERGDRPLRLTEAAAVADALGTNAMSFFESPTYADVSRRIEVISQLSQRIVAASRQATEAQAQLASLLDANPDERHDTLALTVIANTAADWVVVGITDYMTSGVDDAGDGPYARIFHDAIDEVLSHHVEGWDELAPEGDTDA